MTISFNIQLICEPNASKRTLSMIVDRWQLAHTPNALMALILTSKYLQLKKLDEPKLGGIYVDFVSGNLRYRRKFGGGKNEAIAKAININSSNLPTVIDATAGLGRDAFVLAALGCKVTMFERHPVVAALLEDGLNRGYTDFEIGSWLRKRMVLIYGSSSIVLPNMSLVPDVIYIDPMYPYPHRRKHALVKKEMRIFQSLIGCDNDADEIFKSAIGVAKQRIVVKRPNYAPCLMSKFPQTKIQTKHHRFDIYF